MCCDQSHKACSGKSLLLWYLTNTWSTSMQKKINFDLVRTADINLDQDRIKFFQDYKCLVWIGYIVFWIVFSLMISSDKQETLRSKHGITVNTYTYISQSLEHKTTMTHVNKIPTRQYWREILRSIQSKFYVVSLTEMTCNSWIPMHLGLLFNKPSFQLIDIGIWGFGIVLFEASTGPFGWGSRSDSAAQ